MSASIIWPVAAGLRQLFRGQLFRGQLFRSCGTAALRLLPALVLLLYAPVLLAEEPAGKPVLETNSFYLSSAGFRIQVANDPAGQKALRALPAHRFVTNGSGDELHYFYAEPQHCVCIFVGTQQAYDRYRKIVSRQLEPRASVAPDYKTQAGVLLAGQPLRQSTRGDPTTLADYLSTLYPHY
ncbi:hypothetical protein [Bradyrhizobium sp.]|uniref:hypothetical protein n=1 Tax=Bradyrhizobium sp. TaxID=376 RepID=UPI003C3C602F